MAPRFEDLEDELHRKATEVTDLENFGDPQYREGLRVLLRAFDTDTRFTESGWQFAYGTVLGTLIARLHTLNGWSAYPQVLTSRIAKPLVITGIPRTGTTALHKLLSIDPQFQGMEHWLTETPMIRPPRDTWESLPAYRNSVANLEAYFNLMPEMRKAHEMVADEVDECLEILRQSFVSNRFGGGIHLPTYDRWFFEQNEQPSYRHYADAVRLIGAGEPNKRWLLKNPGHTAQIDALFEVFPDARVIHTHRDPLSAIPSLCSTLHMSHRMYEGDNARADLIGARECAYWRCALERTAAARVGREEQFFDVDHRRFLVEPMTVVAALYEFFDLPLTEATQERMLARIAASQTSKHGEHRYRLEDFGLDATRLKQEFGEYRQRYGFN